MKLWFKILLFAQIVTVEVVDTMEQFVTMNITCDVFNIIIGMCKPFVDPLEKAPSHTFHKDPFFLDKSLVDIPTTN